MSDSNPCAEVEARYVDLLNVVLGILYAAENSEHWGGSAADVAAAALINSYNAGCYEDLRDVMNHLHEKTGGDLFKAGTDRAAEIVRLGIEKEEAPDA